MRGCARRQRERSSALSGRRLALRRRRRRRSRPARALRSRQSPRMILLTWVPCSVRPHARRIRRATRQSATPGAKRVYKARHGRCRIRSARLAAAKGAVARRARSARRARCSAACRRNFAICAPVSSSRSTISRPMRCSTRWAPRASSTCSACSRASACRSAPRATPVQMPNMIWLYRRPILDYWAEHEETLGRDRQACAGARDRPPFRPVGRRHGGDRGSGGAREGSHLMKVDGACHCGAISDRGRGRPRKDRDLPLHRLPDRHRLGVPRFGPGARRHVQDDRTADRLSEDHRRQRQSAPAGLLPALRLADLFDDARRRATGMVHRARRHPAPARPPGAAAANLVALGAAVACRTRRHPAQRDRAKRGASALAVGESGMLNRRTLSFGLTRPDAAGADHLCDEEHRHDRDRVSLPPEARRARRIRRAGRSHERARAGRCPAISRTKASPPTTASG